MQRHFLLLYSIYVPFFFLNIWVLHILLSFVKQQQQNQTHKVKNDQWFSCLSSRHRYRKSHFIYICKWFHYTVLQFHQNDDFCLLLFVCRYALKNINKFDNKKPECECVYVCISCKLTDMVFQFLFVVKWNNHIANSNTEKMK